MARLFLLLIAVFAAAPALAADSGGRFITARLIAQTAVPKPGSTILVGIDFQPKAGGWHGYWRNPGDSGIAPSVSWTAPRGVRFGPLHHPAPTMIRVGGDTSFVHEGRHIILVPVTIPRSLRAGTAIPITAKLNWGSCTDKACVPERATLSLKLVAGNGKAGPDFATLAAAKRKWPSPARASTYVLGKGSVQLRLTAALGLNPGRARFFPDGGDWAEAWEQKTAASGKAVSIRVPTRSAPPRVVSGVVSDGRKSYRLSFRRS